MKSKLRAGIGEIAITPPLGLPLLGALKPATGIHDDLFARALVIADETCSAAVVCLDLVGLDMRTADEMRSEIAGRTGIRNVFINCSHTHSAPFTIPWSVLGWKGFLKHGSRWRQDMLSNVAAMVQEAASRQQAVSFHAGRHPAQVGVNRRLLTGEGVTMRPNLEGPVSPWVSTLRADTGSGSPLALLFSHAAHPVIVHAASTLISADYPGHAAASIKGALGDGVTALFAQGCGANINGEPLRAGHAAAEEAGRRLGEAAFRSWSASQRLPDSPLKTASTTLELPLEGYPSYSRCEAALDEMRDRLREEEKRSPSDAEPLWYLKDTVGCLQDLAARARIGKMPALRFEMQALAIGRDWCLLAMPHEVFVDYALWIEKVSPFPYTMTMAYTNGCESYIPTDADLNLGGYEAGQALDMAAALRYPYRAALRPGAERMIREAAASLFEEIVTPCP